MAAVLHMLDQRRLIDSNGIADGASIYFFTTGTLTPAAVYTTSALSVEHPSPIVVAAGAAVPAIYLDDTVTYRRRIVYSDGSVDDTDPYTSGAVISAEYAKDIQFITPQRYGATSSSNSSAALLAAANAAVAAGLPLHIDGTIRVDDDLVLPAGLSVTGTGTIDLSNVVVGEFDPILTIGTGVTRIADLSTDIAMFATTLSFGAAHGLSAGDVAVVWNPTDNSQAPNTPTQPNRQYYRAGDMFRVAEVISTTQVRVYGQALEAYDKDEVQVFKLNGGSLVLDGIKIIPPGQGTPLLLDGLVDVILSGVRIPQGAGNTAIEVRRCYNVGLYDPLITTQGGDAYPVIISNSQKVGVIATRGMYSSRHCLALGGQDGDATVPTADVVISGMIAENVTENGIGAIDIHGGCKRVRYDHCLTFMATIGGVDAAIANSRVHGRPAASQSSGNAIAGGEVVGGNYLLQGNRIVSDGTANAFGSHLTMDLSRITRPIDIVLTGNIFENVGSSPQTTFPIRFDVGAFKIGYDNVVTPFTVGATLTGGTSAATAVITRVSPTTLWLTTVSGTFQDNETITDGVGGSALANGVASAEQISLAIDGLQWIASAPPQALVRVTGPDVSAGLTIRMSNLKGNLEALYSANNSFTPAITGPGSRRGVQVRGDESVTLTRAATESQIWATTLTADRTVTLPTTTAVAGDRFIISRPAGGAFNLIISGVSGSPTLAANQTAIVEFRNVVGSGEWRLVSRGTV